MGFKKRWDVNEIYSQLRALSGEVNSRYNDGFTCFYAKQDLYQIKWFIDEQLKKCPKFTGEDEWLLEEEKKKVINILKDEM